jgi:hypothetical protein
MEQDAVRNLKELLPHSLPSPTSAPHWQILTGSQLARKYQEITLQAQDGGLRASKHTHE